MDHLKISHSIFLIPEICVLIANLVFYKNYFDRTIFYKSSTKQNFFDKLLFRKLNLFILHMRRRSEDQIFFFRNYEPQN